MFGTMSWREPSDFWTSIARPKLTCSGWSWTGLPFSLYSKPVFISGIDLIAWTTAYPIRWVKETLPPRARARWLLMTMRWSNSSFTGTERTLVAVGTARLASMLVAVRAAAPRSTTLSTSPGSVGGSAGGGGVFGMGVDDGFTATGLGAVRG